MASSSTVSLPGRPPAEGPPCCAASSGLLAAPTLTASTPVRLGEQSFSVLEVLTSYLRHVKAELEKQNVAVDRARVVVAVPAHAYGAQRLLTLEAFQQAGFRVAAMLNEPSAAGFEYTHRKATTVSSRRTGSWSTTWAEAPSTPHWSTSSAPPTRCWPRTGSGTWAGTTLTCS